MPGLIFGCVKVGLCFAVLFTVTADSRYYCKLTLPFHPANTRDTLAKRWWPSFYFPCTIISKTVCWTVISYTCANILKVNELRSYHQNYVLSQINFITLGMCEKINLVFWYRSLILQDIRGEKTKTLWNKYLWSGFMGIKCKKRTFKFVS